MKTEEKNIVEYITEDGKCPFGDWLRSLKDIKARAIIRVRINRLIMGNFGDCRSVDDGVFELRIDYGPGYRIYFGQEGKHLVILLCAGTKRRQSQDIQLAKNYWVDYRRRRNV